MRAEHDVVQRKRAAHKPANVFGEFIVEPLIPRLSACKKGSNLHSQ